MEEEKVGHRGRISSRENNYHSNRNVKVKYIQKSVQSGVSSGYADSQKSEQMNKQEQQSESDNEENYSSAKGSKLSDDSQEEEARGDQSGSQD